MVFEGHITHCIALCGWIDRYPPSCRDFGGSVLHGITYHNVVILKANQGLLNPFVVIVGISVVPMLSIFVVGSFHIYWYRF